MHHSDSQLKCLAKWIWSWWGYQDLAVWLGNHSLASRRVWNPHSIFHIHQQHVSQRCQAVTFSVNAEAHFPLRSSLLCAWLQRAVCLSFSFNLAKKSVNQSISKDLLIISHVQGTMMDVLGNVKKYKMCFLTYKSLLSSTRYRTFNKSNGRIIKSRVLKVTK